MRQHSREATFERAYLIALLAFVTAIACGLAALSVIGGSVPGAVRGLGDPFVSSVWWFLVLICGSIGYLFALPLLWRVRLKPAALVVSTSAVVASMLSIPLQWALKTRLDSPLIWFVLLPMATGVAAMLYCRAVKRWRLPSVPREAGPDAP